jgi:hypothetical protein
MVQESGRISVDLGGLDHIYMVLTARSTVTPAVHAGFRQLPGPDHRKCEISIVTREM